MVEKFVDIKIFSFVIAMKAQAYDEHFTIQYGHVFVVIGGRDEKRKL